MRQVSYKPINAEYLAAIKEVVRISDRKHNAWDKVKEFIAKAERLQPQQVKNDCKFPSPTGHPIASRETDTFIIVRGEDGQMRPLDGTAIDKTDADGLLPTVPARPFQPILRYELRETEHNDVQTLYGLFEHYEDCYRFICEFDYFDIEIGKTVRDTLNDSLSRAQPQVAGGDEQLYRFYNVNTSQELIKIQSEHIERLQDKLSKAENGIPQQEKNLAQYDNGNPTPWDALCELGDSSSFDDAKRNALECLIRSAMTAPLPQPEAAKVALDLDSAREVFENWLTAGGNYPHLKHKSFGGQYLHEEAAMKWDGFKAGYCALQTPASDGVSYAKLLDKTISKYQDEIDWLESIERTKFGDESLRSYKVFLKDLDALKQSTAKDTPHDTK